METTITSKNLGHLGLVAGMIDELDIVATIDSAIVRDTRDRHITVGQAIKAMIINGLGFSQRTLYMTSTFFENLPVDVLLGPEISSNHLNDTVLGRALDDIHNYGCTKLYREVSVEMCKQLNLSPTVVCMDSTSFHVDGKYNSENPYEEDSNTIYITRAHVVICGLF